jgi:outer membrane biosynthesis protein TonB
MTVSQSALFARKFLTSAALAATLVCGSGVTLVVTSMSSPALAQDITGADLKRDIDKNMHGFNPRQYPAPPKEEPKPEGPSWAESCWNGLCTAAKVVTGVAAVEYIYDKLTEEDEATAKKQHEEDLRKAVEERHQAEENQKKLEQPKSAEAPKTEMQKTETMKTETQKTAIQNPELPKSEPKKIDTKALSPGRSDNIAPKRLSLGTSSNLPAANEKSSLKVEAAKIDTGHAPAAINLNAGKPLPAMTLSHLPAVTALNNLATTNRFTALAATKR